jgi:hypothetical protein
MKKRKMITLLFITLLSTFSCTNQTVNSGPSNKPSISSTSSPQVSVTPTPQPTPSQDENILSPLPPILAFGQTDDYYYALDGLVEYSEAEKKEKFESPHIFYMNEKVLKEGITKEAILNKDIVDVTEGTYPEYSPDNKLISFIKTENEKKILYIMKAGDLTGKTKQIVSYLDISKYDWINNNEILVQSEKELYIVNVNTKEKILISKLLSSLLYDLSPDKKKIVFLGDRLYAYDLKTNTKENLIENYSTYSKYIISNPLPIYDFYNSLKWSDNNQDIAFISNNTKKIVKVSIKTKEFVELYDLEKDTNAIGRGSIRKIFYYGKDGDLLFFSDVSISSQQDGAGVILALKNTPIDKNSYKVAGTTKKTWISKEKYLDSIYYYHTVPDVFNFIDIERYFKDNKRELHYQPSKHKGILPYSFIH